MSDIHKLSTILFADIAGYTSLMHSNEAQALGMLNQFKEILEVYVPQHEGDIVQYFGDACLLSFESSTNCVKCAMALQTAFITSNIPIRIGIHLGEVVFKNDNVFGDGVNIASRLESMSVPGAIIISKPVRDQIKNKKEYELVSLGAFEFKNVEEAIDVYAIGNSQFTVPNRKEITGKFKTPSPDKNRNRQAIILTIVSGLLLWFIIQNQANSLSVQDIGQATIDAIPYNSIAVLPFTNMSPDKSNEYFADGIHDDLLTHLSQIGDMRVISRTSVLRFRNTDTPIPEIAKSLGVANILEGSVRRYGNKVRINVQLIQAGTDGHLWSEIYDRDLTTTNIFETQSEITKKIASVLKTTITEAQDIALTRLPTESLKAYEAYLKARQKSELRQRKSLYEARDLLEEAIKLDDSFAEAYIHLGDVYLLLINRTDEDERYFFERASENLEKGMSLNDNLAEGYALKGLLTALSEKDSKAASLLFEKAISINPNYISSYIWYAYSVSVLDQDYIKALEIHQKAVRLNPLSPIIVSNLAGYLHNIGELEESIATFNKAMKIEPSFVPPWANFSSIYRTLGQLDSSAIYGKLEMERNPGTAMRVFYFECLQDLNLNSEVEDLVKTFDPASKSDSIDFYEFRCRHSLLAGDYDTSVEYMDILASLQYDDPLLLMSVHYYNRKYSDVLIAYEKLSDDSYMDSIPGLTILELQQMFIFSLRKENHNAQANEILSEIDGSHFSYNKEKSPFDRDASKRHFLKIRQLMLQDSMDFALTELDKHFKSGHLSEWLLVEKDPVFDVIRKDDRFNEIFDNLRIRVKEQAESFYNYQGS